MPTDQQNNIHNNQEHNNTETSVQHSPRDLLRDLFFGQNMFQDQCVGDDKQQRHRQLTCIKQRILGVFMNPCGNQRPRLFQQGNRRATVFGSQRPHVTIYEHRNQEGIDRRHRRRLGRCEDTAVNTAQNNDHQEQAPSRITRRPKNLAPAKPFAFRQVLDPRPNVNRNHQHTASQQPRNNPRKEHPSNGHIRRRGIDHHHNRWWNQYPERSGNRDNPRPELFGIADLLHPCDHNRTNRHHRGG